LNCFVAEIQRGLDDGDADIYNHSFAGDVIWGGPYGATVSGYDDLHGIHQRLHAQGVAGPSRYEIVQVSAPQPSVAIAHVRRQPVGDDNGFAEMAMYVLVQRVVGGGLSQGRTPSYNRAVLPRTEPAASIRSTARRRVRN